MSVANVLVLSVRAWIGWRANDTSGNAMDDDGLVGVMVGGEEEPPDATSDTIVWS